MSHFRRRATLRLRRIGLSSHMTSEADGGHLTSHPAFDVGCDVENVPSASDLAHENGPIRRDLTAFARWRAFGNTAVQNRWKSNSHGHIVHEARVAKLADAPDLGSGTARYRGSSPLSRMTVYMVDIALRKSERGGSYVHCTDCWPCYPSDSSGGRLLSIAAWRSSISETARLARSTAS